MGAKSKTKGDRFERLLRDRLRKWWGCPWERTTLHHGASKKDLPGDLVAINPKVRFPFLVEAKHVEGWTFEQTMAGDGRSKLEEFLTQVSDEAEDVGELPLLLAHRNRGPIWALLPHPVAVKIHLRGRAAISTCRGWWAVCLLSELEGIAPEELARLVESSGAGGCYSHIL